jgi:hypothetical protein
MTAAPRVPPDVPGRSAGLARATSTELDKAVGPPAGRWLRVLVLLGLWIVTGVAVTPHGLRAWLTPFLPWGFCFPATWMHNAGLKSALWFSFGS